MTSIDFNVKSNAIIAQTSGTELFVVLIDALFVEVEVVVVVGLAVEVVDVEVVKELVVEVVELFVVKKLVTMLFVLSCAFRLFRWFITIYIILESVVSFALNSKKYYKNSFKTLKNSKKNLIRKKSHICYIVCCFAGFVVAINNRQKNGRCLVGQHCIDITFEKDFIEKFGHLSINSSCNHRSLRICKIEFFCLSLIFSVFICVSYINNFTVSLGIEIDMHKKCIFITFLL
jgi:hypothetical protein